MQARGRVIAAELAAELEVSVATARRDLEALSAAGIPVYPSLRAAAGRYSAAPRTDLSGLSATEAQALFVLAGPAAAVSGEAEAALRKLVRALPQTFRDRRRSEMVDLLQAAVIRQRKVHLTYAGRARAQTERLVDPWGLVDKDDIWYLIAGTERGQRTFRLDRIIAAEPTDQSA